MSKREPRSPNSLPSPVLVALLITAFAALLGAIYVLQSIRISPTTVETGASQPLQAPSAQDMGQRTIALVATEQAPNGEPNTSEAGTKTAEVQKTHSVRKTRRARNPMANETTMLYRSPTALPPIDTNHREGYWAENLEFGAPELLFPDLDNLFDNVTFSPDGSHLAISHWTGETIEDPSRGATSFVTELELLDLSTGEETFLDKGIRPVWSPDGRYIAYRAAGASAREGVIKTINLTNKTINTITTLAEGEPATQYAWLNASHLVFFQKRPLVFNIESETTAPLLDENVLSSFNSTAPLTFFMASAETLVAASTKDILVLDTSQAEPQVILHLNEGFDHEYWALSPSGQLFAYVPWPYKQVKIVNLTNGARIELPWANQGIPLVESWSPDGASVLYSSGDGVEIVNQDGSGLRQVLDLSPSWPPIWSPKGDQIVWVGDDFHLYKSTVVIK